MSGRERRRAARRKRKQRARSRPSTGERSSNGAGAAVTDVAAEAAARGISHSELKDEVARERLEPLPKGGRPRVVTIGAVVSAAVALITLGAYLAGADVRGERPHVVQVLAPTTLFAVMAAGMWAARYWAVLGFQAVMALLMVGAFLTLVAATSVAQAITAVVVLGGAGTFFWFMVKAMARIQMPSRSRD